VKEKAERTEAGAEGTEEEAEGAGLHRRGAKLAEFRRDFFVTAYRRVFRLLQNLQFAVGRACVLEER
jgi:hypothetical protein